MADRLEIWQELGRQEKPANLESLVTEISLKELDQYIECSLQGKLKGRIVLNLDA